MQQRLKPQAGAARAWIVAPELFDQLLAPVHDPIATLDLGFGREALPAFARDLKTSVGRGGSCMYAWHTSEK
jgi:hypothetical protein